jgi:DNA primase
VKEGVDLSALVLSYGVELTPVSGGEKLIGLCPFHDDTVPSFTVWWDDSRGWSCGCWACPFGPTDLFGFIMEWEQCTFSAALAKAINIDTDDLPEPPPINTESVIRATVSLGNILARGTETAAVGDLLVARHIPVSPEWVEDEFGVCADGGTVLIPHWAYTGEGSSSLFPDLIGIKRRAEYMGWKSVAARGSEFSHLYGSWRYSGCDPETVILCEGESDTWTVSYIFRNLDHTVVVGLPCGVSAAPREEWRNFIGDRDVILLFDADNAGRSGADRWVDVLPNATWVAVLPADTDASSAGREAVGTAVAGAVPGSEWKSRA